MARQDGGRASEGAEVATALHTTDAARWRVAYRVDKYHGEIDRAALDAGLLTPYAVVEGEGNLLLTAGITLLWNLLIGAGGTTFSNANAHLGVGDDNTAAAAGQTDLQASSNKLRKAMDSTYPQVSGAVITFRSTFGTSDANFHWQEWIAVNHASAGTALNRKVADLGTKTSAGSWVLTVTITLA